MRFIDQLDIAGKKLLLRVDFNVPLDGEIITDDNRIKAAVPTIRYAVEQGAAVIVMAHLGKPKGKRVEELSLKPVAKRLGEYLDMEVPLAPDCIGAEVEKMAEQLKSGQVLMLENLRFHAREQGKTSEARGDFGAQLAALADIYVNDAFGVAHRPNASVVDVPYAAKQCCVGFLLKLELENLGEALKDPQKPYIAISGGAKVSTKIGILNNLIGKVDHFIIGGAMANTFLLAQGKDVGKSLVEEGLVEQAREIIDKAAKSGTSLHLPEDFIWGRDIKTAAGVCDADNVPADGMLLDIGPVTIQKFCDVIGESKTIVWNGPMGLFEEPAFAEGSMKVCKAMAESDGITIVGGGDTDAVVHKAGLQDDFTFISTGGGSFLEFLEGKELPAFKALKENLDK
ncbi:phosphoglycerate kinase [Maridesulfovibrio hydrothermalis]|uniref:Phosphoglycerate kinase n=1 Tax=Maridesulfovibrio hydrothermalis AM13 = DSM 14728 TaxID=1121451 RepID=L0RCV5_9BACT|nr:phosphoglycerate kinase [Maridesulfovibrio hydrothermalis]CCO24584.1 phosphoglycerate kinase [Maridesulfovibrio hydrothermalis AM13 = DSM 14728]